MNSVKIAAIILVIVVGLIVGLNFIVKTPLPAKNAILDKSSSKEQLINKKPINWITNITSTEQVTQKEQLSDSFSKLINEINLFTPSFSQLNKPTTQSLQPGQGDSEAVENYYKNFVEALNRANLTSEEVTLIIKTDNGRPLLLEELIEEAVRGKNLNDLKTSFSLWHQLDERILTELNKLPTNSKIFLFHQTMVNWFGYHSKTAKQFSEENLSRVQIIQLAQQFKKEAEAHILKFKQSLEVSKGLGKIFASLIPQAQAVTCGRTEKCEGDSYTEADLKEGRVPQEIADDPQGLIKDSTGKFCFPGQLKIKLPTIYHFGGKVLSMTPCIEPPFGFVVEIGPPCDGPLYFSGPVLAANPYLWKNLIIGINTLGKSVASPDACIFNFYRSRGRLIPEFIDYEATVLYFGSSLVPSPL